MSAPGSTIRRRRLLLAGGFAMLGAGVRAQPTAIEQLDAFIRGTRSGRAAFVQTVTTPGREGSAPRTKTSSGLFAFERPARFRFDYKKPFEQIIVADGQTLWLYDVDLNQVTARPQAQTLASTPAAIVATASSVSALQNHFVLENGPEVEGLQWVLARPRQAEGALQSIRVGLREGRGGVDLVALEILDAFGQRSTLRFSDFERNPSLPASLFQFKPPPKADVLRP